MATKKLTPKMESTLLDIEREGRAFLQGKDIKTGQALEERGLVVENGKPHAGSFMVKFSLTKAGYEVAASINRERRQHAHELWCHWQSPYMMQFRMNAFKHVVGTEHSVEWDMQLAGLPDLND